MSDLSPEKLAALNLLEEGDEYYAYFFHKAYGLDLFTPLKEKGYFSPSNNPEPVAGEKEGLVHIPYWSVLSYLEKAAEESVEKNSREYQQELLSILEDVTVNSSAEAKDNYHTWRLFSKILSIMPVPLLEKRYVVLLDDWLSCRYDSMLVSQEIKKTLLPNLLGSDEGHACELINIVVESVTRVIPPNAEDGGRFSFREIESRIEKYWLRELLEAHSRNIGRKCGASSVEVFLNAFSTVEDIVGDNDYSEYWRSSVEDSDQNDIRSDEVVNMLFTALRDSLLGAIDEDVGQVCGILDLLYSSDRTILNRLAIYLSTERYDELGEYYWKYRKDNVIDDKCKHEVYIFLQKNFNRFKDDYRELVLTAIDGLSEELRDEENDSEEDRVKREAYKKLAWLKAIKNTDNRKASDLYSKCMDVAGVEPEHPEYRIYMGKAEPVIEKSEYSVEQLLDMSVDETVVMLNQYVESGEWKSPTKDGLGKTLKEAIKVNHDKYTPYLKKLISIEPVYQYYILQSYGDLWKENVSFDWGRVLEFCSEVISDEEFWREAENVQEGFYGVTASWILPQITDLIRSGVQNDEHAFDEKHLGTAEEILKKILSKEKSKSDGDEKDPVSYAINSSRGRCIEALFSYSLRMCRLEDKSLGNHDNFWNRIKPLYDSEIGLADGGNYEFSTLCGNYLPNLFYISKEWTESNFNNIFSTKNPKNWRCAINGYSYVNTVYDNIYGLLKSNGHFARFILEDFDKEHVRHKMLQHIMIGYLRGEEPLADNESLVSKIFDEWRSQDLTHIAWFLWTNRKTDDEEIVNRVVEFWSACVEKIEDKAEENKSVLSALNMLSGYIPNLDEKFIPLLLKTAPYADVEHHSSHLIEDLFRLIDGNPEAVGEIFLSMLKGSTPYYDAKNIKGIIQGLYANGIRDKADAICGHYLKSGMVDMVQDIFEENRR